MSYPAAAAKQEVFFSSATLAAHSSSDEDGFRQRDVRFFAELFLNWTEELGHTESALQNTQVLRYLEALVKEGYARKARRTASPSYRLTRLGLLEVTSRLVSPHHSAGPSRFLFVLSFLRSYRERIEDLVRREGQQFPLSLKLELEALLDPEALLASELKRVESAIVRLDSRIGEAQETAALCRRLSASRVPFPEVVAEIEDRYPYELNTQKPLSQLISSIAPDQRQWELEQGTLLRSTNLWKPQLALLKEYRLQLQGLFTPARKTL